MYGEEKTKKNPQKEKNTEQALFRGVRSLILTDQCKSSVGEKEGSTLLREVVKKLLDTSEDGKRMRHGFQGNATSEPGDRD